MLKTKNKPPHSRGGRRRKPIKQSTVLRLYATEEEAATMRSKAYAAGMEFSTWARERLLEAV